MPDLPKSINLLSDGHATPSPHTCTWAALINHLYGAGKPTASKYFLATVILLPSSML